MIDRDSSQVGYRLRGIEPPDLARYPDTVKKMFWGFVVEYGLRAKDRDLARGLDKDGKPMRALHPKTIQYRRSEVGPTFKHAPPLEPSYARSRVRSLLTGRAHVGSAEFFWKFDRVTGASFAKILIHQRDEYGRDVFGLSADSTDWVRNQAWKRWSDWKSTAHAGSPPIKVPNVPGAKPVRIPLTGRIDLQNMTLAGNETEIREAIKAGRFTGFRRLPNKGEKWQPGSGPGGPQAPRQHTVGQKKTVETSLGVQFRPAPGAAVTRESTVLVDLNRIEDAWASTQDVDVYIGTGGRGNQDYAKFAAKLLEKRANGEPIIMPRVGYNIEGRLEIRGGEDAIAVFRDQNAGIIPVTVRRDQAVTFRREFGASNEQIQALRGAIGRTPRVVMPKQVVTPQGEVQPEPIPAPKPESAKLELIGNIDEARVKAMQDAIDAFPEKVHQAFELHGARWVYSNRFADHNPMAADQRPIGWPEGMTWAHTDGAYFPETKTALACHERLRYDSQTEYVKSYREIGVMRHETGHGLDDSLGYVTILDKAFLAAYEADVADMTEDLKKLLSYYLQEGRAGRAEAFAEVFAQLHGGGASGANLLDHFRMVAAHIRKLLR